MRGMNNRQMTIKKIKMVQWRRFILPKGGKRVPLDRRGPRK